MTQLTRRFGGRSIGPHPSLKLGEVLEGLREFSRILGPGGVELLNVPEPPPDRAYGDPAAWLLSTSSVHPLRYDHAVRALGSVSEDPEG